MGTQHPTAAPAAPRAPQGAGTARRVRPAVPRRPGASGPTALAAALLAATLALPGAAAADAPVAPAQAARLASAVDTVGAPSGGAAARLDSAVAPAASGAAAKGTVATTTGTSTGTIGGATAGSAAAASAAATRAARAARWARDLVLAEPAGTVSGGSGAEVLHVQVLLDAAGFNPGQLDGKWSENTLFAVRAFRDASGLPVTDVIDPEAYRVLRTAAAARPALTTYVVNAADVRYPFKAVPKDVRAKARADCLCYASLLEKLGEQFHVAPTLLQALNPGVDFAAMPAGTAITVPNTWRLAPKRRLARLLVHKGEGSLRGLDADGKTIFWLPATVGSTAMPTMNGAYKVTSVTRNPHYRWDPDVLKDVSRKTGVLMLPPGPNSPVGAVWIALSRKSLGIHGTPDPEHVGYTASHGCVRLSNWDALWLSRLVRDGMTVEIAGVAPPVAKPPAKAKVDSAKADSARADSARAAADTALAPAAAPVRPTVPAPR